MIKDMKKKEKLLHELELKLWQSTCYSQEPLTIKKFLYHLIRHILLPFKRQGWFGYCDSCGKFRTGLSKDVVDTDYDVDEEGGHAYPIYGMVCENCFENYLEN